MQSLVLTGSVVVSAKQRSQQQVRQSWLRCRSEFDLKPEDRRGVSYVGLDDLHRRRRRMGSAYGIATIEMQSLDDLMEGGVGIALTDADGIIVHFVGGVRITESARRSGMREGAVWSEAAQGTNGMGTCLAAGAPVLIERGEHYLQQNAAFTCCAAPIHDGRGAVVGVLNVSSLGQPSSEPMMALVANAARAIESRALLTSAGNAHVLRFHPVQAFVTTAGRGLLVIDKLGHVLGANRSAIELLSVTGQADILDRQITDLAGVTLCDLKLIARRHPWCAQRLTDSGFYGLLQSPTIENDQTAVVQRPLVTERPLAQAERTALLTILEACDWNVTLASRQLQLGRKTLYRKMDRYKLVRPGASLSISRDH